MPFYYNSKRLVKVGDSILWGQIPAKIVYVFEDGQCHPDYSKDDYSYAYKENNGMGIGLVLDNGQLVIDDVTEDIQFVK